MGRALTIYILHCGDDIRHDPENTVKNIVHSGVDFTVIVVPSAHHNLNELLPDTHWKLFIYSDEWISKDLVKALPSYLEQDTYNVLSLFRLEYPADKNDPKLSICPRLFTREILFKVYTLQPSEEQPHGCVLSYTNIMDGFIFGKKP
jgi:hypothetical protein